jgi:hypothetical protein
MLGMVISPSFDCLDYTDTSLGMSRLALLLFKRLGVSLRLQIRLRIGRMRRSNPFSSVVDSILQSDPPVLRRRRLGDKGKKGR